MREQTILIISQLDFLEAGNQILLNTCLGFLNKGYKIVFLTSNTEKADNIVDYNLVFGDYIKNIYFYRFSPVLRPFFRVFKLLYKILLFLKNAFTANNIADKLSGDNLKIGIEETVDFVGSKAHFIGFLSWLSFIFGGIGKSLYLLQRYKPVIVVGYEIYGAPVAFMVSKIGKIPLVTKFQGTVSWHILEKSKFKAWLIIPHHLLSLKIPANLIIMENDGTRGKEVLLNLGVEENRIRFWIDGVKKDIYLPNFNKTEFLKNIGISEDSKILLTLSRLKIWKRVDRAIWALSKVKEKISNTVLIVVGDGEVKHSLQSLAEELGVKDDVIFLGAIPHSEIKNFINGCDIFLSLYDHSNLCNPILEALECGKCIVTIDDGTTREILKNGYNSMLIPKDKLMHQLPNTIVELLTNNELRKSLENQARKCAEENLLSWHDRMKLEVEEIERLLK